MAEYKIGDTRDLGCCTACGNVIVIESDNGMLRPQMCGNPVRLRDESWLCGSCLRKLRIQYPREYRTDPLQHTPAPFEHVSELNAAEAAEALSQIHTYQENLREQYGFHQAVFTVENVTQTKAGFLKPPYLTVTGHVIYGTFYTLDEVGTGPDGMQKATISCLYQPHSITPVSDMQISRMRNKLLIDFTRAEGGEEAAFIFQDKSLHFNPGDLIVKD